MLDAVRLYAARGHRDALVQLVERREVFPSEAHSDSQRSPLDFTTLRHRWNRHNPEPIQIGPADRSKLLKIAVFSRGSLGYSGGVATDLGAAGMDQLATVSFDGQKEKIWVAETNALYLKNPNLSASSSYSDRPEFPVALACESIGPGLLTREETARLWDRVALTDYEDHVVSALNIAVGGQVMRVAMLAEEFGRKGRRIAAKVKGHEGPVSLRSLGDGAVRLFGVALALANCEGGFLVIDEAENGIHHSVHPALWQMVFQTAHRNNVQVLATTHSWDCVRGFAAAASRLDGIEGVLVRLEGAHGRVRAVEYTEEDLAAAAEQGIEVR